jgi:putative ABC transport system substrate-binding protein
MKRRGFLGFLSGGAIWPLVAAAQQPPNIPKIGYLGVSSLTLEGHNVRAFRQKLRELGYLDGEHILVEYRWANGQDNQLPILATELVRLKCDVIVTTGTPGTLAAMHATKSIPIIMASSADPVSAGLVASLARPGGNVTGFTILGAGLEGKRLGFLQQAIPDLTRVAVIWNPNNPAIVSYFETLAKVAAPALGITLFPIKEVRQADELDDAFAAIARVRPEALAVVADRFLLSQRTRIVEFALSNRLPGVFPYREYVDAGGLMSFGPNNTELFRGAATYVVKILKGAAPGDLPVQEPTQFDLIVNLKTARAIGLTVAPTLLARADEIIE